MAAEILSFFRRRAASCDWSTEELAEFYRVEAALVRSGMRVVSARGLTDENDPWFVFCSAADDDVIIHFARIDGRYLISSPAFCGISTGYDFRKLVQRTIERHPVLQLRSSEGNLYLHPATLLVVLVATAFLQTGHADETATAKPTIADTNDGRQRAVALPVVATAVAPKSQHETLILAAISAAIAPPVQAEPITIVVTASTHSADFVDQSPTQPAHSTLLDVPGGAVAHGSGSVAQAAVAPQTIAALQPEGLPTTPLHIASSLDVAPGQPTAGTAGGLTLPTSVAVALPIPVQSDLHLTVPDLVPGARLVALDALSSIPKADIDLLHDLHVPNNVLYLPTLPEALSGVLKAGAHTGPVHSPDAPSPSTMVTTAPDAGASHDAGTATPTATVTAAATTTPAASTTTAVTASSATAAAMMPDISSVLGAVQQFQSVEVQPVVVMTDHAVIFYDASAAGNNFGALKSITYDFGNGFSVSLVGLPAELAHVSLHV